MSQFATQFEGEDPKVIAAVHEFLTTWQGSRSFRVEPEDDLGQIYGIVDEDVDESIREVLEKTNRSWPHEHATRPVVSVREFVEFVQASPPASAEETDSI